MVSQTHLQSIVEAGIWAPSADNCHQIEFELLKNSIALWQTKELRQAPFHRRVLGLIGLGSVVENMLIRASSLGLAAELKLFPDRTRPDALAHIDFRESVAVTDDLDSVIRSRCTNRRLLFKGPGLSNSERASLEAEVARVDGVKLLWFDRADLKKAVLRLLVVAESERFRLKPLHAELFASIRFDVGWTKAVEQGLPPGALEVDPPVRWAFRALRYWPLMRILNVVGMHRAIALRAAYMPCRLAPHLCALATYLPFDDGCLAVGRSLERIWLRASASGFAVQPFAAPGLLALEGYQDVTAPVRKKLVDGWRAVTQDVKPLIVFRMGRAKAPSVRALRRSVHSYLRALAQKANPAQLTDN